VQSWQIGETSIVTDSVCRGACVASRELIGLGSNSTGFNIGSAPASSAAVLGPQSDRTVLETVVFGPGGGIALTFRFYLNGWAAVLVLLQQRSCRPLPGFAGVPTSPNPSVFAEGLLVRIWPGEPNSPSLSNSYEWPVLAFKAWTLECHIGVVENASARGDVPLLEIQFWK
jgi:hypothetical protein